MRLKWTALAFVGLLPGCVDPETRPLEQVVIVAVACTSDLFGSDCYTAVEFPDGTRLRRYGAWGEVGDTLNARRQGGIWY